MVREPEHHVELNACGLTCPMPLIQTKLALNSMLPGEVLKVVATDAGTKGDFKVHCQIAGHEILHQDEQGSHILFWIQRG